VTAHQELQAFAEHDLEPAPRWALAPYLFLTQVAEELACGHIILTDQGRSLFIRVRTPFAASSTLKFVTLRTYSLILLAPRGLKHTRFERDLSPAAAQTDPQEILAQATDAVTQTQTDEQDFIQPEQSAPFQTKNPELLAFRATLCTGAEIGTVLPSTASNEKTPELAPAPEPAQIYLL
jgi:hypothetical protein